MTRHSDRTGAGFAPDQNEMEGIHAPAGSLYRPMLISHRLNNVQTVREAPAQHCIIPRGQKNSGTAERFRGGDERLKINVRLGCGMSEESEGSRVSRNSAAALHDNCSFVLHRFRQLGSAIKSMDLPGKRIACVQIGGFRRPHETPGYTSLDSPSLEAGKGLPDIEPETRVERERPIVIGGLHQPDPDGLALVRPIEYSPHQHPSSAVVLYPRVDRYRTDARDHGTLVQAVAPHDAAVRF